MPYVLKFEPDEKDLFEAFWIGYKSMDLPKYGIEVGTSVELEKDIKEQTTEGGSIKLGHCPGCGQRIVQYSNLRTLNDGEGLELLLDQDALNYIKACFGRWERVMDEMREPFAKIYERIEGLRSRSLNEMKRMKIVNAN